MKTPRSIKIACQILRNRVRFYNASLTLPNNPGGQNDTPIIRQATRLYVETWVIPILDMIERGDLPALDRFCGGEPRTLMDSVENQESKKV